MNAVFLDVYVVENKLVVEYGYLFCLDYFVQDMTKKNSKAKEGRVVEDMRTN